MSNMGKIVIVAIIAAVAIGVVVVATNKPDDTSEQGTDTTTSQTPSVNQQPAQADTGEAEPQAAVTVTYTDNGFVQDAISVKSGDTVEVVNDSGNDLELVSDPHPLQTDNQEFNVGLIAPGETKTFVVTQTGTWGFHNHLRDAHTGSLMVE
jgi:plastocyanin